MINLDYWKLFFFFSRWASNGHSLKWLVVNRIMESSDNCWDAVLFGKMDRAVQQYKHRNCWKDQDSLIEQSLIPIVHSLSLY